MPEPRSGIFFGGPCLAGFDGLTMHQSKGRGDPRPLLCLISVEGLEIAKEIQQDDYKERNAHEPSDNAFHLILHAAPVACLIGMKR
jgi:hypothetical protein